MPVFDYLQAWLSKLKFFKLQLNFLALAIKLFVYHFDIHYFDFLFYPLRIEFLKT